MSKDRFAHTGLSWLKRQKIRFQLNGKTRSVKLFGGTIFFTTRHELLHGIREIFVDKIYQQELRPNALIIDCGANIGLSVIYLKQLCPDARIIAFEPDDVNYGLLEANIRSLSLPDVQLRKQAVWTQNTELSFATTGTMSSRIEGGDGPAIKTVTAVRLKDLLNEPVDFLKLDIEGAEYEVLKDIRENLMLVKHLFLEYHGNFDQTGELSEIFSWLAEQGFQYYIKEASNVYHKPFSRGKRISGYDVQLNIFCFRPGN